MADEDATVENPPLRLVADPGSLKRVSGFWKGPINITSRVKPPSTIVEFHM